MLHFLSDSDLVILKRVIADNDDLRENTTTKLGRDAGLTEATDHQAPETYIARPKTVAGIAARVDTTPGKADCDIWKIVDDELIDGGFFHEVFNLSLSSVPQRYLSVTRTKFGKWVVDPAGGSVRMGEITGYAGARLGTGSGTGSGSCETPIALIDGLYHVNLYKDDTLSTSDACNLSIYPDIEKFCCSIIDEVTGEYIGCAGDDINTNSGTGSGLNSLDCKDLVPATGPGGDVDISVIAHDLPGRVLEVGTKVAVAVIGSIYVIVEAAVPSTKVCFISDIACGVDCDDNPVFLKTYTPVWIESWKVCDSESEFVPVCSGTGTGPGNGMASL